ncbi:PRC-barrel domain-containing protein [Loktanella atrilutea]|uniref:PRC-barrel domain-containing protein n=1 Tax=Loktanella atrilutea TaxID=366533 RepID=A0A1M4THI9_LOKAT|nr:PRC-barrel domain-containing protein [Loktanella atrilutea]SHE43979.1 PRC-barrel domain-containing protein [Loktanella atrilutea]
MNILKTSTAALALTLAGSMVSAESHMNADGTAVDTNAEQAEQSMENAADSAGNAVENAADATGNAVENAADATGNAVENAAADVDEMQNFDLTTSENLIRTRDITGGQIWRMDAAEDNTMWTDNETYEGTGEGWERIGSIEDVVLSRDGQMVGIVGEVGGFLGLGDKMVLMPVENVRLTALDDGTYAYVTQMTQEDIEAAQDVDEGFWE